MSLNDFVAKYNGKAIDFDGAFGNQCVDLMNQYLVDCLGIGSPIQTLPGATAFEIYQNAQSPLFDKIGNTPDGVPLAGDIVFWDTSIGSAGHVDVFLTGDQSNFTGFDQNWPVGSLCHKQTHDYNGVVGWLHPKVTPSDMVQVDSKKFEELVHKSTLYDAFSAAGYNLIDDVIKKVGDLTHEKDTLNSEIISLNQANETISASQKDYASKELEAEHSAKTAQDSLQAIYKALNATTQDEALKSVQTLQTPHNEVVKQVAPVLNQMYQNLPKGKKLSVWGHIKAIFGF